MATIKEVDAIDAATAAKLGKFVRLHDVDGEDTPEEAMIMLGLEIERHKTEIAQIQQMMDEKIYRYNRIKNDMARQNTRKAMEADMEMKRRARSERLGISH